MARTVETTNSILPALDDQKAFRHFGDGTAGEIVAARLQGYSSGDLAYVDVAVDSNGDLKLSASAIDIGTVDQGTGGSSAWKVSGSVTASGSVAITGGTIGTITNSVAVTGTFWQATQPVSGTVTVTGSVAVTGVSTTVSVSNFPTTQPVSGTVTVTGSVAVTGVSTTVSVSNFPGTQPVSGTVTATGSVTANPTRPSTPTQSTVASTTTNSALVASNANRLGATIFNDSTANLYVKLGTTATTGSFSILVYPSQYYEVPFAYTGQVDGLWASANGNARVTELTA